MLPLVLNVANVSAVTNDHGLGLPLQACKDGQLETVQAILNGGDAATEMERRDTSRRTPLHLACWAGHLDVVKALCVAGAKVTTTRASTANNRELLAPTRSFL